MRKSPQGSAQPGDEPAVVPTFADLALSEPVMQALAAVGYEAPSPIQAATIPVLLAGQDMLGQAQTGAGGECSVSVGHEGLRSVKR